MDSRLTVVLLLIFQSFNGTELFDPTAQPTPMNTDDAGLGLRTTLFSNDTHATTNNADHISTNDTSLDHTDTNDVNTNNTNTNDTMEDEMGSGGTTPSPDTSITMSANTEGITTIGTIATTNTTSTNSSTSTNTTTSTNSSTSTNTTTNTTSTPSTTSTASTTSSTSTTSTNSTTSTPRTTSSTSTTSTNSTTSTPRTTSTTSTNSTTSSPLTTPKGDLDDRRDIVATENNKAAEENNTKGRNSTAWAAIIVIALGVGVLGLILFVVLKRRRRRDFSHRKLMEDFSGEPELRLGSYETVGMGTLSFDNPVLQGDSIRMDDMDGTQRQY